MPSFDPATGNNPDRYPNLGESTLVAAMGKRRLKLADHKPPDAVLISIVDDLRFNRRSAIVTIRIPSHDKNAKLLPEGKQSEWAKKAMRLFADLFVGATALETHGGIYKSDAGDYLWDDTILIQSYARPGYIQDDGPVRQVVDFARQMRRDLDQEAVLVILTKLFGS